MSRASLKGGELALRQILLFLSTQNHSQEEHHDGSRGEGGHRPKGGKLGSYAVAPTYPYMRLPASMLCGWGDALGGGSHCAGVKKKKEGSSAAENSGPKRGGLEFTKGELRREKETVQAPGRLRDPSLSEESKDIFRRRRWGIGQETSPRRSRKQGFPVHYSAKGQRMRSQEAF